MKIVVTEPQFMSEPVRASLTRLGQVSFGPFDDRSFEHAIAHAKVLVVRLGRLIDAAVFAKASGLRFVVTAATGLDHIDLDAAKAAGVRVISLRDCPESVRDVSATAEHTIGLMLALLRHIPSSASHVLAGGWDRTRFWGSQVRGKRLGIIGYGRVGSMVAQSAAGLGMRVVAFDSDPQLICAPAEPVTFEELLQTSDIVSIHATSAPENRHLLDRKAIERLKAGGVLINTARGHLIDEIALAAAIRSGNLAGVAADVLDGEERGGAQFSPLLACARAGYNVLITPHIGGAAYEAIARAEAAVVDMLETELKSSRAQVI